MAFADVSRRTTPSAPVQRCSLVRGFQPFATTHIVIVLHAVGGVGIGVGRNCSVRVRVALRIEACVPKSHRRELCYRCLLHTTPAAAAVVNSCWCFHGVMRHVCAVLDVTNVRQRRFCRRSGCSGSKGPAHARDLIAWGLVRMCCGRRRSSVWLAVCSTVGAWGRSHTACRYLLRAASCDIGLALVGKVNVAERLARRYAFVRVVLQKSSKHVKKMSRPCVQREWVEVEVSQLAVLVLVVSSRMSKANARQADTASWTEEEKIQSATRTASGACVQKKANAIVGHNACRKKDHIASHVAGAITSRFASRTMGRALG
jgi:hypothetical protein